VFDQGAKTHKIPKIWRSHFAALALMAETGKSISFENFEQHSAYLIRHFEIKKLQEWERDFLAQSLMLQKKQNISLKDFSFKKNKKRAQVACRLLVLLQTARWLTENFTVSSKIISQRGKTLWKTQNNRELFQTSVSYEFEAKKRPFEKLFKTHLILGK
jgi:exopolyphosphatase/pppGpp-phosphohydrolase